jgi:hypothetical protein
MKYICGVVQPNGELANSIKIEAIDQKTARTQYRGYLRKEHVNYSPNRDEFTDDELCIESEIDHDIPETEGDRIMSGVFADMDRQILLDAFKKEVKNQKSNPDSLLPEAKYTATAIRGKVENGQVKFSLYALEEDVPIFSATYYGEINGWSIVGLNPDDQPPRKVVFEATVEDPYEESNFSPSRREVLKMIITQYSGGQEPVVTPGDSIIDLLSAFVNHRGEPDLEGVFFDDEKKTGIYMYTFHPRYVRWVTDSIEIAEAAAELCQLHVEYTEAPENVWILDGTQDFQTLSARVNPAKKGLKIEKRWITWFDDEKCRLFFQFTNAPLTRWDVEIDPPYAYFHDDAVQAAEKDSRKKFSLSHIDISYSEAWAEFETAREAKRISAAAAALGARGGSSKSPAKQAASCNNGKLGGRPKMMRDVINELEVAITANEFDERDMKSNHPTPGSR